MAKWYQQSEVKGIRSRVEQNLKGLPPSKDKNETATAFWERVEKAGRLLEALELYDKFEKQRAQWAHMPRETKKMFAERIEREGRQAEVEEERKELLEEGHSLREIHEELVNRFQPLDGSHTRPWETPDPWKAGRLFRKKEDQDKLLAEAKRDDGDDYCPKSRWRFEWKQQRREKRIASENAEWRVDCAKWRRDERVALAKARRRLRELQAAAEGNNEPKATEAATEVNNQRESTTAEEEPKIKGKWIVVRGPSGSPENQWVPEAE